MTLQIRPGFEWWDPSLITTGLWLDASDGTKIYSDAGTTLATNGQTVQQWNDKSNNGTRHAKEATNKPTYTTNAQNGLSCLTFNGTSSRLSLDANYNYGTTHTLFLAAKNTGSTITASSAGTLLYATTGDCAIYAGNWTGAIANERIGYYQGSNGRAVTDADISSTLLISAACPNSLANMSLRLNGASSFASINGTGIPANIQNIGHLAGAAFFNGQFYELIIVPSPLSADVVEKAEGYLAHKWGLTVNLPSDHPYKTNAPAP